MSTSNFVQKLLERFKNLMPIYEEHLRDNEELLPHVFFGDFTRWLLSLYTREVKVEDADAVLRAIFDYLEEAFSSEGEDIQELISVSLLENLPLPGEQHGEMGELLGPKLKVEYEKINGLV